MHGSTPTGPEYDVLIVGAGISGIGLAAYLERRCPGKRYVLIEQRERIGGTWDLFRYPGVRSDSDMYTLGYSFEPWRDGNSIATGETIREYLQKVATKYAILPNIRFGRRVETADWNSATGFWTLGVRDDIGSEEDIRGRFLFFGSGYYDYDNAHDAEIPGIDTFSGLTLHPQFWPDGIELEGKKVVVVGSGATAATIVPAMAGRAAHVTMLQRTPSWYFVAPRQDWIANLLRKVLPAKLAYAVTRMKNVFLQNRFIVESRKAPDRVASYLTKQVKDELCEDFNDETFTPPYAPWDQRVCLIPDGDLFKAMRKGKASIVTGRIDHVDASGLVLEDGGRLDADIIVTATGLRLTALGNARVTMDGDPVSFPEHFYYRNCMFSNVPNLAALFGYLNAAWTLRVEMVADWLCRLFREMDARDAHVVTPVLPDDHDLQEEDIFWGFTSGYLHRGRHLIPKSANAAPWRLGQDYFADRKDMRKASLDDGCLRFERAPAELPPR